MDLDLLAAFGLTIAAAVGPISLLCIRRTLAVFLGSAAWWVVLVTAVGALRMRITPNWLRCINVASGVLIGGSALVALASVVA